MCRMLGGCSVTKMCPTLHDPMGCRTLCFPVLQCLLEFAHIHVHCVGDAIQPSHSLSPSSPFAFSLSHDQDLFQWLNSSPQVVKVLELQFQNQSFQWSYVLKLSICKPYLYIYSTWNNYIYFLKEFIRVFLIASLQSPRWRRKRQPTPVFLPG